MKELMERLSKLSEAQKVKVLENIIGYMECNFYHSETYSNFMEAANNAIEKND